MLSVVDLHVGFSLPGGGEADVVRGVSFEVAPGERFGLVGESGCGKTTTMLAAMGLLPSNAWVSGSVVVNGHEMLTRRERAVRRLRWTDVAMVPQASLNALNPVRTVGSQIAEPMLLHGTVGSRRAAMRRAAELLELVGVTAQRTGRYPHEFSGGMRQRAAIAMALACNPKVLLADEPTTALDVIVQAQILDLLTMLTEELGLALVLVTHDLAVVAQVCPRAAVMYAGEVAEMGPVDALYHQPGHPYTAKLFAATPDLRASRPLTSIPGSPPRLDEPPPPGCAFEPRCSERMPRCTDAPPPLYEAPKTLAACYLNDSRPNDRLRAVDA
jgi:peptide/nickel transport system ATP-binding protein